MIKEIIKIIGLKLYYWTIKSIVSSNKADTINRMCIALFSILLFLILKETYSKIYFNSYFVYLLMLAALLYCSSNICIIKRVSLGGVYAIIWKGRAEISMEYKSFSNVTDIDKMKLKIGLTLTRSFSKLYSNPLFNKYKVKTVYVKTHEDLAYRLISLNYLFMVI